MAAQAITFTFAVDGLREVLDAFNRLPKEANAELREAAGRIAALLAVSIQAAAAAEGRQAARLGDTVKVRRDRVPSVQIGGTRRLFHGRKDGTGREAFRVLFGSEFGSNTGHGFKRHRGQQGYWIFPTVERKQSQIADEWLAAADRIVADFVTLRGAGSS